MIHALQGKLKQTIISENDLFLSAFNTIQLYLRHIWSVKHHSWQSSFGLSIDSLCMWAWEGCLTSVANPMAWRNNITYQPMSTSHHSIPALAEYSNAWWLLCQLSPNEGKLIHLSKCNKNQTIMIDFIKYNIYTTF